jgi:type VI secretion system protein ImpA
MNPIDVSTLTEPVSADAPSGADLEYDPGFIELEESIRIEPEQQFGDTVIAAEEPDWVAVRNLAVELLSHSKDLRAVLYLVQALLKGNGLCGLSQGLALIRGLLVAFWDSLHPQLDPDDYLDPTVRVNIIASLCDQTLFLTPIRTVAILQVPGLGGISLRDVQIAKGLVPPPPDGEEALELSTIEAGIQTVELSSLKDAATCVDDAVKDTAAIEQFLMEKVGAAYALDMSPLTHTLREAQVFLQEQLSARGEVAGPLAEEARGEEAVPSSDTGPGPGVNTPQRGEIANPQDVIKALDTIVAYYEKNEPSSPVPLLLLRAKRLVSLGFMEILRDIAPDALSQAATVTGAAAEGGEYE